MPLGLRLESFTHNGRSLTFAKIVELQWLPEQDAYWFRLGIYETETDAESPSVPPPANLLIETSTMLIPSHDGVDTLRAPKLSEVFAASSQIQGETPGLAPDEAIYRAFYGVARDHHLLQPCELA